MSKSLLLSLALASASLPLARASPSCFSVDFKGHTYSESSDTTVFSYSVTSSAGAGCSAAQLFSITAKCPLQFCEPAGQGLEEDSRSWHWRMPQELGSTLGYDIYVPGKVGSVATGQWAIKTSSENVMGTICVPDCLGGEAPEPTLPNAGEPCVLVSDQPIISVGPTDRVRVEYTLGAQPAENIEVSLTSDCAKISTCSLTFTPDNWNVPQRVSVTNDIRNPNFNCTLRAEGVGASTPACSVDVQVAKRRGELHQGMSYGDPYVFTMDSTRFKIRSGTGTYYLLRQPSSEIILQNQVVPCAGFAECNEALALRYRTTTLLITMDSATGNMTLAGGDAASLAAEGISLLTFPDSHLIGLNSQAFIKTRAEYISSLKVYSLEISVRLGKYYNSRCSGLLGNFNLDRTDEWTLPDGTLSQDLVQFQEAWKVPDQENLFSNPAAAIGTLNASPSYTDATFDFLCVKNA